MSKADAARAIQSLNGQDMGGRPLKVNEAQDKPRRRRRRLPPLSVRPENS